MKYPFLKKAITLDFERHVSQASLLNPADLDGVNKAIVSDHDIPILVLNLPSTLGTSKLGFGHGLVALGGCDILFLDAWRGNTCTSFVANLSDPAVVDALSTWNKVGFIRILFCGNDGKTLLVRQPYEATPVIDKALADSASKNNFLATLLERFELLLQPDGIESVFAARMKRVPNKVNVGFVVTEHSHPGLPKTTSTVHEQAQGVH